MDRRFVEEAYRKLKGSVYLDKTLPFLREQIVKFEGPDLEEKLESLFQALTNTAKWTELERKVLGSIRVLTFPKRMKDQVPGGDDRKEPVVISNVSADRVTVEKYNNFIDMCVEGHVIGVLWILTIGYHLDKELYENCCGNRLMDNIRTREEQTTASPNLFKPYFQQYESWRNEGLKMAEDYLDAGGRSVVLTMLDLSRYYYNIDYTEEKFYGITAPYTRKDSSWRRINDCVYRILTEYSRICGFGNRTMLPIGFLPSNILANYFLADFDQRVVERLKPLYYGRYVDDMLLVTEAGQLSGLISEEGSQCVSRHVFDLLERNKIIRKTGKTQEDYDAGNDSGENGFVLEGYPTLRMESSKFRFFYIGREGSREILEKIRRDISQNTSEFHFIPEASIDAEDEDVLKLEREDTVNKLRAINRASVDKYALSKALGKKILMSRFSEKGVTEQFAENLYQVLDHRELLGNYTVWESILNYFVINDELQELPRFTNRLLLALDDLDEISGRTGEYQYLNRSSIVSVKDSLIFFYHACLMRSCALVWGREMKKALKEIAEQPAWKENNSQYARIFQLEYMTKIRKGFCHARMINKALLPAGIENCMAAFRPSDEQEKKRLYSLKDYIDSDDTGKYRRAYGKYAPYCLSPFDILFSDLLAQLRAGREPLRANESRVRLASRKYAENFQSEKRDILGRYLKVRSLGKTNRNVIEISSVKKSGEQNLRIAVANVRMAEEEIGKILDGAVLSRAERCKEIGQIVNEAIRHQADMLVMPEAYVPLDYLEILQQKAARHNMVIICGIEHIRKRDLVYNLTATLIPLRGKGFSYTVPFFHQKSCFSPHELEEVKKRGCRPAAGCRHVMFCWSGISFASYCCYELTSIRLRSLFLRHAELIFGVEWNKDTHYFGNIMESLSRDLYCYCIQANMSEYGDSRIVQPAKKDLMNILQVKGGLNASVLIGEVNVAELRRHREEWKSGGTAGNGFKPLPAGWGEE